MEQPERFSCRDVGPSTEDVPCKVIKQSFFPPKGEEGTDARAHKAARFSLVVGGKGAPTLLTIWVSVSHQYTHCVLEPVLQRATDHSIYDENHLEIRSSTQTSQIAATSGKKGSKRPRYKTTDSPAGDLQEIQQGGEETWKFVLRMAKSVTEPLEVCFRLLSEGGKKEIASCRSHPFTSVSHSRDYPLGLKTILWHTLTHTDSDLPSNMVSVCQAFKIDGYLVISEAERNIYSLWPTKGKSQTCD